MRIASLGLLVIIYLVALNAHPDFSVFNAHDSESYLALSYDLIHGRGYTRNLDGPYIPHTTWPPGVPLLMAPAVALSGNTINWVIVKCWTALIGLFGVVLVWLYIRRVSDRTGLADLCALAVGLNPYYWHFSHMAMSETPTFVWTVASLLLIDKLWTQSGLTGPRAFLAGLLVGAGMLIRGTLCGLILTPLAYLVGPQRSPFSMRRQFRLAGAYAVGFLVFTAAWSARNSAFDRSKLGFDGISQFKMLLVADSTDPTSPVRSPAEIVREAAENVAYHIVYNIPEQVLPWVWILPLRNHPLIAVLACAALLLQAIPLRTEELAITTAILPPAAILVVYAAGGSARYWVPLTGLLTLLLLLRCRRPLERFLMSRWRLAALVVVLAGSLAAYIQRYQAAPYTTEEHVGALAALFDRTAASGISAAAVRTPHSHAFRLITGLSAPMESPGLGIHPAYSHAIIRTDQARPSGFHPLITVYPWTLVALSSP